MRRVAYWVTQPLALLAVALMILGIVGELLMAHLPRNRDEKRLVSLRKIVHNRHAAAMSASGDSQWGETPDFEPIARGVVSRLYIDDGTGTTGSPLEDVERMIAEQLRLVWNARGDADLATTESPDVIEARNFDNADETWRNIQRAIRSLDR